MRPPVTAAFAVALAAVALVVLLPRSPHHARLAPTGATARRAAAIATEPLPQRPEIGFASAERLDEHYRKHGREFGHVSKQRYLRLAQALRDRPAGGLVLEAVRKDGVITRYDRGSGAFIAFDRDGTIRTFFRPARGDAYFRSQLSRSR